MGQAVSFRTTLDKARQKHRPSWLNHWVVPLTLLIGLGFSTVRGQGKLDQLFAMIFSLSVVVWGICDSHIFGVTVDLEAGLEAIEETIDAVEKTVGALQSEIDSLRSEVAFLQANADDI